MDSDSKSDLDLNTYFETDLNLDLYLNFNTDSHTN